MTQQSSFPAMTNHLHETVRSYYHKGYTGNQWCGKTTLHLSIYVTI